MHARAIHRPRVRRGLAATLLFLVPVALTLIPLAGAAQNVSDGFNPDVNGPGPSSVYALAVQADGKIVVGGFFTMVDGQSRNYIARLGADGSLDTTFVDPNVTGPVNAVAVQTDGKILVGGNFTMVGGQTRHYLARLNPGGSLDVSFGDLNANNVVNTFALQADGKILVGGNFSTIGGQTRNSIARLNSDGNLDLSFGDTGATYVSALALQADGRILVGGLFTTMGGQPRHSVARLNDDGSLDGTFGDPGADGGVTGLAIQPDGKITTAGYFTTMGGQPRHGVARLNSNGSLDTWFADPNTSNGGSPSAVYALALQSDGKVVVGGAFVMIGGQTRGNAARLNPDGTLDATTFGDPHASAPVRALVLQADGKVLVGGDFTQIGTQILNHVVRLNSDGSLDATLALSATGGQVSALAVQPDGRIVGAGAFTTINAVTARAGIARFYPDGTLDMTYNPNPTAASPAAINSMALQPDGELIVAGYFTAIGGQARNKIARLNVDGTADAAFDANQNPNDFVSALAVQTDGKIVVGGPFTYISGKTRNRIARLNGDGTLDAAFDPNADSGIGAIAVLPDGKLVVAGSFTKIGGQTRHDVARLNADGSLDMTFVDPEATGGNVSTLAVQPDGKIIVGGFFTMIGGQTQCCIARLNANGSLDATFSANPDNYVEAAALQLDGKIVIGGLFNHVSGQFREYLARLNADGSLDMTFAADANNSVLALALQPDGKLLAGGIFTMLGGQARGEIARLSQPVLTQQSFDVISYTGGGNSVTWARSGIGPELTASPTLQFSTDSDAYSTLGLMERTSGGWRYVGLPLPPMGQHFYLRASGRFSSGQLNGSGGVIETTGQFYLQGDDGIFANGFE